MSNNIKIIELEEYKDKNSKVFSGKKRGIAVRKELKIDELDKSDYTIEVIVPKDTFSINASFFLGLFSKSIKFLGEESFRGKYIFDTTEEIRKNIDEGIRRALKMKSVL